MAQYPNSSVDFDGDGVTKLFDFDFPYQQPDEVFVSVDGVNVAYVWAAGSTNTVEVTPAPALGTKVRVYRSTEAYAPRHLFAAGTPFLPRYVDENSKQILYALQEGLSDFTRVEDVANDALEGVAAAEAAAQAAQAAAAEAVGTATRAVRVSDAPIPALPDAATRANKVLSFDAQGNPTLSVPASGSAADLALALADSVDPARGAAMLGYKGNTLRAWMEARDTITGAALLSNTDLNQGAALVGRATRHLDVVADLARIDGRYTGDGVMVTSYHGGWNAQSTPKPEGGGTFVWAAGSTRPVDTGSCFYGRTPAAGRWLRLFGAGHVLATEFGAQSQRQSDATIGINAALDYIEPFRGKVVIPDGSYMILGTILLRNFCTLEGTSKAGTTLGSQFDARNVPVFANKDTGSFIYTTLRRLNAQGGTAGLISNVTGETAYNLFEELTFSLHTAGGFSFNKMLQTSSFVDVTFDRTVSGIACEAPTANLNYFERCNFMRLSSYAIKFISSEVNNFVSCQFEEGGINGNIVLLLDDCRNMNFYGCYFERTHNILVWETKAFGRSGVKFDGCHFTGSWDGTQIAEYGFVSDGAIIFGTNSWYMPSDGSPQMYIVGDNGGKLGRNNGVYTERTRNTAKFTVATVAAGSGTNQYRVARLFRSDTSTTGNFQTANLEVKVNAAFVNASGITAQYVATFPVAVTGLAAAPIAVVVGTPMVAINTGSLTVTLAIEPGPTASVAHVRATVSGANAPIMGFVQASVDSLSGTVDGHPPIEVMLPQG